MLSKRKILITGASGGIGLASARRFAQNGDALFLHAFQNSSCLAALQKEFPNVPMTVHQCDLGDLAAQDALVEAAWNWNPSPGNTNFRPGLEVLIQTAGIDILTGEQKKMNFEQKLDALWKVDVQAGIRIARNVAQRIVTAQTSGSILLIGWNAVEWGMAGDSAELFAAAKGAVTAFARSLAQKVGPNVRVNCVAPGWIQTRWGQNAPQAWQELAMRDSLMNRWGTPEDAAQTLFFLASPEAGFLNGQVIAIDGGKKQKN